MTKPEPRRVCARIHLKDGTIKDTCALSHEGNYVLEASPEQVRARVKSNFGDSVFTLSRYVAFHAKKDVAFIEGINDESAEEKE